MKSSLKLKFIAAIALFLAILAFITYKSYKSYKKDSFGHNANPPTIPQHYSVGYPPWSPKLRYIILESPSDVGNLKGSSTLTNNILDRVYGINSEGKGEELPANNYYYKKNRGKYALPWDVNTWEEGRVNQGKWKGRIKISQAVVNMNKTYKFVNVETPNKEYKKIRFTCVGRIFTNTGWVSQRHIILQDKNNDDGLKPSDDGTPSNYFCKTYWAMLGLQRTPEHNWSNNHKFINNGVVQTVAGWLIPNSDIPLWNTTSLNGDIVSPGLPHDHKYFEYNQGKYAIDFTPNFEPYPGDCLGVWSNCDSNCKRKYTKKAFPSHPSHDWRNNDPLTCDESLEDGKVETCPAGHGDCEMPTQMPSSLNLRYRYDSNAPYFIVTLFQLFGGVDSRKEVTLKWNETDGDIVYGSEFLKEGSLPVLDRNSNPPHAINTGGISIEGNEKLKFVLKNKYGLTSGFGVSRSDVFLKDINGKLEQKTVYYYLPKITMFERNGNIQQDRNDSNLLIQPLSWEAQYSDDGYELEILEKNTNEVLDKIVVSVENGDSTDGINYIRDNYDLPLNSDHVDNGVNIRLTAIRKPFFSKTKTVAITPVNCQGITLPCSLNCETGSNRYIVTQQAVAGGSPCEYPPDCEKGMDLCNDDRLKRVGSGGNWPDKIEVIDHIAAAANLLIPPWVGSLMPWDARQDKSLANSDDLTQIHYPPSYDINSPVGSCEEDHYYDTDVGNYSYKITEKNGRELYYKCGPPKGFYDKDGMFVRPITSSNFKNELGDFFSYSSVN